MIWNYEYYISLFLKIVITGLAALLLIVSTASWRRLHNIKLALISVAFASFFIKGFILVIDIFLGTDIIIQNNIALIIDLVIIISLYFSAIKK
ncbi:hypothetical protein MBGDN05_00161 [Thermoplasmatales archaeon SCGC AB-539-N05]|nr:hypothetical protein MBGDN05_00161 [Thermoplasmatales archaeon SCGC AB-539-N05]